jgi:hypothetical protein
VTAHSDHTDKLLPSQQSPPGSVRSSQPTPTSPPDPLPDDRRLTCACAPSASKGIALTLDDFRRGLTPEQSAWIAANLNTGAVVKAVVAQAAKDGER